MRPAPAPALALLVLVVLGLAVGFAVDSTLGSQLGYLAVPLLVAIGWLRVADPTRCEPRR